VTRIILLLITFPAIAFTQSVTSITFAGVHALSETDLLETIQTKEGRPFYRNQWDHDLQVILNAYRDKHYYLASIDSVQTAIVDSLYALRVFVTEHRPIRVHAIEVQGAGNEDDALARLLADDMERTFQPDIFSRNMDRVIARYESDGYPLARVVVRRVTIETLPEPHITLVVRVDKGSRGIIRDVRFEGLTNSRPESLKREMRLGLPAVYSTERTERGLARIRKLPYLTDIGSPRWTAVDDTTFELIIPIREGRSNRMDGVAGYVPRQTGSSEKGYLTALIEMSFTNLTGVGRRLDFRWHKPDRRSQEFLLAYTEPWVLGYPVNVAVSVNQRIQDTLYVDRQFALHTIWQFAPDASVSVGGILEDLRPSSEVNGFLFSIPTSELTTLTLGFTFDRRDNPLNPRSGVYYQTRVDYIRKHERSLLSDAGGGDTLAVQGTDIPVRSINRSVPAQRFFMDVLMIHPLTRRVVLGDGMHAAFYKSKGKTIPVSEQFRLGGLNDLRGYVEDFFTGSRIGWNNLELRYLTSAKSRLFLFFDLGHYFRYDVVTDGVLKKRSGWPMGYGFGMRVDTRLGIFALDYGLGRNDVLSNGKVHFGFTSEF